MSGDVNFDDDLRIARLVMADGPKTDAEYALAQRVIALAAATSQIEAQVRAQIAAKIEAGRLATKQRYDDDYPPDLYARGILYGQSVAARIARGDS